MQLVGWSFTRSPRGPFDPEWRPASLTGDRWISDPVDVAPSSSLILSWNAVKPHWSGLSLAVAVRLNGVWTDWVPMGEWGQVFPPHQPDGPVQRLADTATCEGTVDAVKARVRLIPNHRRELPELKRLVISLEPVEPPTLQEPSGPPQPGPCIADVPFRSQMTEALHIRKRICGPACLAMHLCIREPEIATRTVATLAYDATRDIYGNWAHISAVAGSRGYAAWAQRLSCLREVEERLLAGYSAIVSIAFEPGALPGSPIPGTSGHLVVLRGWNESGDPVCNDPAFADARGDATVYPRQPFEAAWAGHGGAVILLRPE
jgi:hypothetical protein